MKKFLPYVIVLVLFTVLSYSYCKKKNVKETVSVSVLTNNDSLNNIIVTQQSLIVDLSKVNSQDSATISRLNYRLKQLNIKPKELETKIDMVLLTSDSGQTKVETHTDFVLLDNGYLDSNVTQHFSDTTKHLLLNGEIDKGVLSYKYQYVGTYELLLQRTRKNIFNPYMYKTTLLSDDKNTTATIESVRFLNPKRFEIGLIGNVTTDNYRPQFGVYGEYTKKGFIFGLTNTYFLNNKKVIPMVGLTVRKQLIEF